MYGLKPGPLIFEQSADQVRAIFAIALITQVLLFPCGWAGIRAFGWILRLPRHLVMTCVVVFSVVGAFALRNSMFDVCIMAVFGLVGYYLESQRVPVAPLILGMILGPMVEENLRTGLIKTEGDFLPFLTRPICLALWILLLLSIVAPLVLRRIKQRMNRRTGKPDQ